MLFVSRLLSLALLAVPAIARADFYDRAFELRVFFAVDRQSNYSTTLARQASLAALEGASANPGAAAWRETPDAESTLTASFVDGLAGRRQFVATPVSVRWQRAGVGTIALAYAHTETAHGDGDDDLTRALRSDEWIGGYGRRLDAASALGFTARITSGKIVNDEPIAGAGTPALRNATRFLAREIHAGYAHEFGAVSFGVAGGYSLTTARTAVTNRAPIFVLVPRLVLMVPPDTLLAVDHDTIRSFDIGAGIGYAFDGDTHFDADARALRLATHHSGEQNLGRFAFGVDHDFDRGWTALAGVSVDTIGNTNWSAGVAYRPLRALEAQLTFQSNAAPELNPELGRTRLLAASLAWRF